jgi:methionine-rich copper-binding protein CopC
MTGRRTPVRATDARDATLLTGLALLVVLVVLVGGAGPAVAHANLVGAVPADGSTVESAPTRVTLRFDENIRTPSVIVVDGPDGKRVDHGATTVVDNSASVAIRVRASGAYTVAYRVLSADGHPVSARTGFTFRGTDGAVTADRPSPTVTRTGHGTRLVVVGAVAALVVASGILVAGRRRRPKERL